MSNQKALNIYSDFPELLFERHSDILRRKEMGQFFTPYVIAKFMIDKLLNGYVFKERVEILDPSSGLGVFLRATIDSGHKNIHFTSYEIDENLAKQQSSLVDSLIVVKDYLKDTWHYEKYDFIIANPPYLKHINIENKDQMNGIFSDKLGCNFPITTNYYCYFIYKSLHELKKGGRAVFIVPGEFLNSNYGISVKEYFLQEGSLSELLLFDNSSDVFRDAISLPSILVFNKKNHSKVIFSRASVNNSHVSNNIIHIYPKDKLQPDNKWRNYFSNTNNDYSKLVPLNSYARAKRGIATGANEFFILNENTRIRYKINTKYLKPCITNANQLKSKVFKNDDGLNLLKANKDCWLLYLNGYQMGEDVNIDNYINWGITKRFNEKYLTKVRSIWFSMENLNKADILVSTFSRDKFKFILNKSDFYNLTCYHVLTFKPEFQKYLYFFFAFLLTAIAQDLIKTQVREHGNGLLKIEPNDLNSFYLPNLDLFSTKDIEFITNKMESIDEDDSLREINEFFEKKLGKLTQSDTIKQVGEETNQLSFLAT